MTLFTSLQLSFLPQARPISSRLLSYSEIICTLSCSHHTPRLLLSLVNFRPPPQAPVLPESSALCQTLAFHRKLLSVAPSTRLPAPFLPRLLHPSTLRLIFVPLSPHWPFTSGAPLTLWAYANHRALSPKALTFWSPQPSNFPFSILWSSTDFCCSLVS